MKKELIINKAVLIRTIVLIVAILNQIASVIAGGLILNFFL